MANTINQAYIDTFESNVRHLAQQEGSRLRSAVTTVMINGQNHNWERISPTEAAVKSGRLVDTPVADIPWSRRVSVMGSYHAAESTESEDYLQMLVDPNSAITRNLAAGMNRRVDDIIIGAATADALDGDGVSNAFPASQEVGGSYTAAFTTDLIQEVGEKFQTNDIDPDEEKFWVVSPKMVRQMLNQEKLTSSDYQAVQALAGNGMVSGFLGFNFILSNRLLAPAANQLDSFAFTRAALGLQINGDIIAKAGEDPSKSFATRFYTEMHMGAVRVEDEQIVRVKFNDA